MFKAATWLIINGLSVYVWTTAAYLERGYNAVGGEWGVIILTGVLTAKLLRKRKKKRTGEYIRHKGATK